MGEISQWNRNQQQRRIINFLIVFLTVIAVISFGTGFWLVFLKKNGTSEVSGTEVAQSGDPTRQDVAYQSQEQHPESDSRQEQLEEQPSTGNPLLPSVSVSLPEEQTEDATKPPETSTPTVPETVPDSDQDYIDIVAVGDNLFHWSLSVSGQQPDGTWDYSALYQPIQSLIEEADIAVINQEVPMAGEEYGIQTYPRFNVPQQLAETLVKVGFDVVTLATNHALDQGRQGLFNTVDYWNTNYPDILVTGAYSTQEKRDQVPYIECKGMKIAFLNYTYGTNSGGVGSTGYMLNYMKEELIRADIAAAKQTCDYVIVCLHWGTEYRTAPDGQQQQYAMICAEAGADVILGTHPHVLQPVSWVTAANGNSTLVYYSLGNFASLQDRQERLLGGMAKLRLHIEENEAGEKQLKLEDYDMEYIMMHYTYDPVIPAYSDMTLYPWSDYTQELAQVHGLHQQNRPFSLETLQQLIDRTEIERKP